MKQIKSGAYLSPQTEVFSLRYEGVLCGSGEKGYDGTNEGYSSNDDLFEIF